MEDNDPRDLGHAAPRPWPAERGRASLGAPPPVVADVLLAALVGVSGVLTTISNAVHEDEVAWGVAIAIAITAPLLVRRRWPFVVVASASAAAVVSPVDVLYGLPLVIGIYTIGAHRSWQAATAASGAAVVAATVAAVAGSPNVDVGGVIATALLCATAAGIGAYIAGKRTRMTTLEERTERLNREQRLLAERAVAEERVRIA